VVVVAVVKLETGGGEVIGDDVCAEGDWSDLSFPGCWADIVSAETNYS
jgi:hypothetical protein